VVKQLWVYIKEHELQNPKDKRKIVLDDALGRLFKPPLNMFNMNKQLSRHVYVEGAAVRGRLRLRGLRCCGVQPQ
jgi:upstream activation factor subunit UAF30